MFKKGQLVHTSRNKQQIWVVTRVHPWGQCDLRAAEGDNSALVYVPHEYLTRIDNNYKEKR